MSEQRQRPRVATVTFSDTRTAADDRSGALMRDLLSAAGFCLAPHHIVRETHHEIRAIVERLVRDPLVDALITTGGTGVSPRDGTADVIGALLDKRLDGFGEAFRRLSWDDIGPKALLSRALAGSIGTTFVACLPGSRGAVRLGIEALVVPTLDHAVDLLQGRGNGHHHGHHQPGAKR